ncbi:MAG: hypothetical protein ACKVOB_03800 [Sphingomonas sp.]
MRQQQPCFADRNCAGANTDADTNTNTNTDADADTNTNANANTSVVQRHAVPDATDSRHNTHGRGSRDP